jgi:uncharacterized protein DUF4920
MNLSMKKLLVPMVLMLLVFGTMQTLAQDYYGEKITNSGAINADELVLKMTDQKEMDTKVEGKVVDVCQVKGCWMTMQLPDGNTMRVSFKDYEYFVPKDIGGKIVVIKGTASIKTTPVDELQHYAEDKGASKEEIENITAPKEELTFEADGVIVL